MRDVGRKQGTAPCAACKLLRRRCAQDCIFAPYFPADEPQKFANVHKVFGASNVSKLLQVFLSLSLHVFVGFSALKLLGVYQEILVCLMAILNLSDKKHKAKELGTSTTVFMGFFRGGERSTIVFDHGYQWKLCLKNRDSHFIQFKCHFLSIKRGSKNGLVLHFKLSLKFKSLQTRKIKRVEGTFLWCILSSKDVLGFRGYLAYL